MEAPSLGTEPATQCGDNAGFLTGCIAKELQLTFYLFILFIYFCLFAFSRAAPAAYGGSQARGLIGAIATGLRQSHSNTGSKLHLRPTP